MASTVTTDYSPTSSQSGYTIRAKKKKKSKADTTLNMSTQILPYVNSAMEFAAGQLGTGTSLRKVEEPQNGLIAASMLLI